MSVLSVLASSAGEAESTPKTTPKKTAKAA
jgi:hypothetical protein